MLEDFATLGPPLISRYRPTRLDWPESGIAGYWIGLDKYMDRGW
jgi:hypothetical protein